MTSPAPFTRFTSDLNGRTVVITGASSGIGLATATALAAANAHVVIAVRDTRKGSLVAAEIRGNVEVRRLDLTDLHSIRSFADDWTGPIDVLVNNAGISTPTLERTQDGFELQFGTNHLGPFALTNLLLPHISGRVVTLASQAERMGRLNLDDLNWDRTTYTEPRAYATSKLANMLFSAELQRRLTAAGSEIISIAAHPGFVKTNIYDQSAGFATRMMVRFLAQTPADGALPVLYAATANIAGGSFTGPERFMHMRGGAELIGRSKFAKNAAVARRLWNASEQMTGVTFPL
ncbi:oxidoreductase [Salinibacterium sp.]|uniref:oxidoreductase n=1 Tax=Salinibacterium sp. TaxID=1915057 RepID=UPI00286B4869|nr:oxidoreductase [Salinibacterium sp.]